MKTKTRREPMMKRIAMALTAVVFAAALGVMAAQACGEKGGSSKSKGKDKAAFQMNAQDLKNCPMTDKPGSKDDMPCYVCPMKEYAQGKPGKCPKCGMELKKMYCPMKKDAKGKACPFMKEKATKAKSGEKT